MDRTERHLRAGLALYAAGEYHAAHDPWERRWLELGGGAGARAARDGTAGDGATGEREVAEATDRRAADARDAAEEGPAVPDEETTADRRFLQGLVQTTAAVYHATTGNRRGATGLAESAQGYLDGLGPTYRGVALDPVRSFLDALAETPETVERRGPVAVELDGAPVDAATLEFETLALCVEAVVEEYDLDAETVDRAIEYGRADLAEGRTTSQFVSLLVALVEGENRPLVARRLSDHVARRDHRETDVEGLFDVDP